MKLFNKLLDVIIKLLLPLVILTLLIGLARAFLDLRIVFRSETISAGFDIMITNVLSLFVVIELLRSIMDYFDVHRLRLKFITDAAIVFILRELMIGIYRHSFASTEIGAMSILLLVIGIVRTLAITYSPEKKEVSLT